MIENESPIEISFKINAYIVSTLTISGLVLNSISIIVFWNARGKQPLIGS